MPISKNDALVGAESRDAPEYTRLCEMIDETIRSTTGTGRMITVTLAGVPRHISERAVATYQAIGWSCEVVPDQREGDYLQLI
jgi:hypothetical protein